MDKTLKNSEMENIKVVISDFDWTLFDMTPIEDSFKSSDKEVRKEMEKVAKTLPLSEGFREVLDTLTKKGILFGILSNNQKSFIEKMVKWNKIETFDIIGRYGKEAKYPYRHVPPKHVKLEQAYKVLLEKYPDLNLKKSEILYIGDEETDAIETRIFGGKSGGCLWFSRMRDTLLSSDYVDYLFEKPTDILKLVG